MIKKILITTLSLSVIFVLSACIPTAAPPADEPVPPTPSDPANEESATVQDEVSAPDAMEKDKPAESAAGQYVDYSAETLAKYKGKEPVALFFHAPWCPTCRVLDSDIKEQLSGLGGSVIKIDYDNEKELKKEYQIVVQHTVVFLNADGTVFSKRIGANIGDVKSFFNSL